MKPMNAPTAEQKRRSRLIVALIVFPAIAPFLYVALGKPGMKDSKSTGAIASAAIATPTSTPRVALLAPEAFEDLVAEDAVLLNVHIPFEGDLEGTKLSIPFDQIAENKNQLPADKNTPLLVYCRSGRMSAIAAAELTQLGYKNVSDLAGGMVAWQASGRSIVKTPPTEPNSP
jgi:rhodanese-related sulfurtransferase